MSTNNVIKHLLDENLIGAKKEIEELLYSKLGEQLQEKYMELAPSLVEAKKKKRPDFLDFDDDGDEKESMTQALDDEEEDKKKKKKKKKTNEDRTPAQDTLRPGGAGKDEPGDLSKRKAPRVGDEEEAGHGLTVAGTEGY
jgi:DNA mismatch repair ATPase MutL